MRFGVPAGPQYYTILQCGCMVESFFQYVQGMLSSSNIGIALPFDVPFIRYSKPLYWGLYDVHVLNMRSFSPTSFSYPGTHE